MLKMPWRSEHFSLLSPRHLHGIPAARYKALFQTEWIKENVAHISLERR
jgi:hypothetical protein